MGFDSLAVSGHKFFALNEPAGVFLCRKEILQHLTKLTVPYLGGIVMPTISCSRSGFDVLKLYWRIMTTKYIVPGLGDAGDRIFGTIAP